MAENNAMATTTRRYPRTALHSPAEPAALLCRATSGSPWIRSCPNKGDGRKLNHVVHFRST
jgi:hypothetical protein